MKGKKGFQKGILNPSCYQGSWNKGKKLDKKKYPKMGFQRGHSQFNSGRTHFKKGCKPWCTGTKGVCKPNRTSFQKGYTPWNKGLPKEKNPLAGRPQSEISKKRKSEAMKGRKPWITGRKMSEEAKRKLRLARLKQILPNKETKIEVAIYKELNKRNHSYTKHKELLGICQPDVLFEREKLAVFCDGGYWHNIPKIKQRDVRINKQLEENGWAVLRFWESQINTDVKACVGKIEEILRDCNGK